MSTTAQDDEFKKWFEANFLDGEAVGISDIKSAGYRMVQAYDVYEMFKDYLNHREHDAELRGRSSEIENILNSGMTARSTLVDRLAELKKLQGEK